MYSNISPLDYRYQVPELEPYFSEEASVRYMARVEVVLIQELAARSICSAHAVAEIQKAADTVTAEAVYEEEKKTRHDIRALVNVLRSKVSDETKPWIHWCATSYDIRDTAHVLRLRDGISRVLIPQLIELEKVLIGLALREKATVQIGRTHGQHAVPVTFGFTVAGYVERLGNAIVQLQSAVGGLKGKFSGAVGAYSSLSLFIDDPVEFEISLLRRLGLEPAAHSTQIIPPEYVLNVLHTVTSAFGVLAQIARDMRHLQRTEIGEVGEEFKSEQVGSSTMPHKRNPVTFENVESLWKVTVPRMTTYYLDQVSEHQRDLTNSASQRFQFELPAALAYAAKRLAAAMEKIGVDKERLRNNFEMSRATIIAEPLYLLLAYAGHPGAHEAVKQLTLKSQATGVSVRELVDCEFPEYVSGFSDQHTEILRSPEQYIGQAIRKTEMICQRWRNFDFSMHY